MPRRFGRWMTRVADVLFQASCDPRRHRMLPHRRQSRQHDPVAITWHWRLQGINLTGRYDHILHTDKFTCLAARVITKGQSDHYPVVAEFAPATK